MKIKILGISASLRNARRSFGNDSLVNDIMEAKSQEQLNVYLKQEAAEHLQNFIKAGREEKLPFDKLYTNLKKLKGHKGLSNSEVALVAALWSAKELGAQIDHLSLSEYFTEGKKSKVLRTNLEVTRFFYQSKDSLFAQEVKVTDLRNNKKKQYKIWQSSSDVIIPDQLQKNGILTGDVKPLTITNYERNPESPFLKEISYKSDPLLRLSDNIYEYSDKQRPVKSFYRTFFKRQASTYALLGEKFSDKFVYILNEEHKFEEDNGREVLAPVKEGPTKTTIKTIGDIQRVWIPAITSFIVILGIL